MTPAFSTNLQAHEKLVTRTVVKSHISSNPHKFLMDLGFKQDYEVVLKGRRYRIKRIETTIYKVLSLLFISYLLKPRVFVEYLYVSGSHKF